MKGDSTLLTWVSEGLFTQSRELPERIAFHLPAFTQFGQQLKNSLSFLALLLSCFFLSRQAGNLVQRGDFDLLVDPLLFGDFNSAELRSVVSIILSCVQKAPSSRPTMTQVTEGDDIGTVHWYCLLPCST